MKDFLKIYGEKIVQGLAESLNMSGRIIWKAYNIGLQIT
jgi:hypothetical protein